MILTAQNELFQIVNLFVDETEEAEEEEMEGGEMMDEEMDGDDEAEMPEGDDEAM